MDNCVLIGKASKLLGVCQDTLREWDKEGKIRVFRTTGGQRRFQLSDIQEIMEGKQKKAEEEKIRKDAVVKVESILICPGCGEEFEKTGPNHKYCTMECYNKYNQYRQKCHCFKCGKFKTMDTKDGEGRPICQKCNSIKGICSICKNEKTIYVKSLLGKPICGNCYNNKNQEVCYFCNILNRVATRNELNRPICYLCWNKIREKEECFICHKLSVSSSKDENNNRICSYCYKKSNQEYCCKCGNEKSVCSRNEHGMAICDSCCRKLNTGLCYICNNIKIVSKNIKNNILICHWCNQLLPKFDNNIEEIRKYLKHTKPFHHVVFEYLFNNYKSEYSVSRLISDGIFNLKDINGRLRYDYYNEQNNILIELNEPCHYSLDNFLKRFRNKTEEDFKKYVNDFENKVKYAKENNIELIIIDVNYHMKWEELEKLYNEKIYKQ